MFDFDTQIARLDKANLLNLVVDKFVDLDLHPQIVSKLAIDYLYEELIRRHSVGREVPPDLRRASARRDRRPRQLWHAWPLS